MPFFVGLGLKRPGDAPSSGSLFLPLSLFLGSAAAAAAGPEIPLGGRRRPRPRAARAADLAPHNPFTARFTRSPWAPRLAPPGRPRGAGVGATGGARGRRREGGGGGGRGERGPGGPEAGPKPSQADPVPPPGPRPSAS